jgi:hypothetical protein
LLVKATQCTQPASIITDLGARQVRPGDWIIEGENREHYVVDDAFFQRTFAPIPWGELGREMLRWDLWEFPKWRGDPVCAYLPSAIMS